MCHFLNKKAKPPEEKAPGPLSLALLFWTWSRSLEGQQPLENNELTNMDMKVIRLKMEE